MNNVEIDPMELKRLEKLRDMFNWRMRPGANGHQQSEAESLLWGIGIIEDCLGL